MPGMTKERVLTRGVLIFGIILYIYYTNKGPKETQLAQQKDVIHQRGMSFNCDSDFSEEISNFPGCIPAKCGRYVSDKLVTASETDSLLRLAKRGFALGGSEGGASILDLHSGALSYGKKFVNIYSMDESKKIFKPSDLTIYKLVKEKIKNQIAQIFKIDAETLYLTHPTFFSKLNNKPPKTEHDQYWHLHIDKVKNS